VAAYYHQPLPRKHAQPRTPISLACVSIDGGRMQTRRENSGPGVHDARWRETKNALFLRMKSGSFLEDPHPDLPACFADRQPMKSLLSGVGEAEITDLASPSPADGNRRAEDDWRPERLFRTCLSSLADSDTFGRLMEVEPGGTGRSLLGLPPRFFSRCVRC
jgi:hypothetical protein